ncbi:hypothetical protein CHARACLAT_015965 [Characodon lateralis]|uniref:Uncharacterized protein n=1 Tax=Characodon lateralis TaxID=208331 RepID=A0ABU7E0U9_9TELE|nr:hypothetical protein [Characodon lateralis]
MCGENHELGKEISGEQLLCFPALSGRFFQDVAGVSHLQKFKPVMPNLPPPPQSSRDGGVFWLLSATSNLLALNSTASNFSSTSNSSHLVASAVCKVSFSINCRLTHWSLSKITLC